MIWPEKYDPETSAIYALNDIDVKAPPQAVEIGVRVEFPTEGLAGASHRLPRAGCRQTRQYEPIKSTLTPIAPDCSRESVRSA